MKKLMILCLAFALLLSSCGAGGEEPTQSTQETVEQEGELPEEEQFFGMTYMPEGGFNPYTCTLTVNRAMFSLLYECLFTVSNQFRAEPVLCQSFTVSEDGKTYRFTLVEGVHFSDGTPLTADDVVASLQAAKKSDLYSGRLAHIYSLRTDGSNVVVVRLDTAYENFSLMLDVPIVKADTVNEQRPTGTGAYMVRGNSLLRNSGWWQSQVLAVSAPSIRLQPVETPNDIRDSFEFGDTDLVYCDPNSPAALGYRCDYEVWEVPTTVLHYIGFNVGKGIFSNKSLRTAITWGVDRETLANTVYGGFAQASVLPCSPDSDLYDTQLAADYAYSNQKLRTAIKSSGVQTSEGNSGVFLVCSDDPARVKAAEAINQELRKCGLYLTVKALSWENYRTALRRGNYDMYYGEVRLTANFDLSEFFKTYGNLNLGDIGDATLSTLCTAALENSGNYTELCKQIIEQAPICPVVFKSYAICVTRGAIASVTPAVDCIFHNAATARTLADADKTYDMADPTQAPTEDILTEPTESTEETQIPAEN